MSTFAQGIEFFHGSLAEALKKAKTEEKMVFIDCFTTWCGPCKRMAATVFPDPEVGAFINENFIALKVDMEKEGGSEISDKYIISAYPTLLFLDSDGKLAQKKVGALSAEALIDAGRKVMGKTEQLSDWTKNYEEGKRDPETMFGYIRVLNRAGKSSTKVANEYLKTQTDLTTEPNLKFLFEATTEADSRIFDLFIQNRDKISLLMKPEAVDARIEKACDGTVKKAIEFKTPELLKEAKVKMVKNLPNRAEKWSSKAEMDYFAAMKNLDGYLDACKDCQKTVEKGDHKKLLELARDLANNFPNEPKALKQAEKWCKIAAENGNLAEYWFQYAKILEHNGKKSDARDACNKAKIIAGDKDAVLNNQIDVFLEKLKETN
jgi:thiol-disulfide isomerase/thioredoxin